jgi:NH3-dependent NAD+ synthetase
MQTEKVVEYITKWLKDYLESSHAKGFAIGVSGGIDSAIVSTLCARTGAPVLVIEMPIRQSAGEIKRSRAHIQWLTTTFPNVTGTEVNLTEVFETFSKTVNANEVNEVNPYTEIAFGNMRSRLRMVRKIHLYFNKSFDFGFFQRLIYIILLRLKVILLLVLEIKLKILVLVSLQNTVSINIRKLFL